MALIVEDGTGVKNANSYVTSSEADDYFSLRNNATWKALTTQQKEAALISASSYADMRWGDKLRSRPLTSDQALEMPRRSLHDRYGNEIVGVPRDWKRGVMEYAVQASQNALTNEPVRREAKEVRQKRVTVGPITTSSTFVTSKDSKPAGSARDFIVYTVADELCKRFTVGFGHTGRVIRA